MNPKTVNGKVNIKTIDAILPQTQCGDCTYTGCLPYAKAMLHDNAPLNLCLPGGIEVLQKLSELFQQDIQPLIPDMEQKTKPKRLAVIREDECIGCTKCIQACPVDAIFGSAKHMHTVIQTECTGCALCVEPCPVDCIDMVETSDQNYDRDHARNRFQTRNARLAANQTQLITEHHKKVLSEESDQLLKRKAKQQAIAAALARVEERKK